MEENNRPTFTIIKSEICHDVKRMGDYDFIVHTLTNDTIRKQWNKKRYFEAFYFLGMIDYLCRIHDIPICSNYNDLRCKKLAKPVYPVGMLLYEKVLSRKKEDKPIPEFLRYNIYEYNIRDVC